MATESDLINLLLLPNETLSNEYKNWLELTTNEGKATLAKAAIALANHGGGTIVLGMVAPTGSPLQSVPLPAGMKRYDTDLINSAVNRYADPKIHCDIQFKQHPHTGVEHAFVSVPGLSTVPIMSVRDQGTTIYKHRCYIRKPGPQSEEPHTSEEWRALLNRCVLAGRENLLDSIRNIIQGIPAPAAAKVELANRLLEFAKESHDRWTVLKRSLPNDDPAHIPLGRYEYTFEIRDVPPAASLKQLKDRLDAASAIKHTGWGPFVWFDRKPIGPVPVNGVIEAWIGHPDEAGRDGRHSDFWRAHPDGRLFLLRSLDEDFMQRTTPGLAFDLTMPIWRLGEALLYVARFAMQYAENPTILARYGYYGLQGRVLGTYAGSRAPMNHRVGHTDWIETEFMATALQINDNLTEVLHPILLPLYESFDLYELRMDVVAQEVARLRGGNF